MSTEPKEAEALDPATLLASYLLHLKDQKKHGDDYEKKAAEYAKGWRDCLGSIHKLAKELNEAN